MKKKNDNTTLTTISLIAAGLFLFLRRKKNAVINAIGAIYNYFTVSPETTLDSLKKQYYQLAKRYHPDAGGDTEIFKAIGNEYEAIQKLLMKGANFTAQNATNAQNVSDAFKAIIDRIIHIPGISIEIIGSWIWVSGNTFPVKEELKESGFKFQGAKKMWYWHAGDYVKRGNSEYTIDDIRARYGSQEINTKDNKKYIEGVGSLSHHIAALQLALIDSLNDYSEN